MTTKLTEMCPECASCLYVDPRRITDQNTSGVFCMYCEQLTAAQQNPRVQAPNVHLKDASLRDLFACFAMMRDWSEFKSERFPELTRRAYLLADAMLNERSKT